MNGTNPNPKPTGVKSSIHAERIGALDALSSQRQAERAALLASHEDERANLAARHEATRAEHDAKSIALLETAEKDAQRRHAEVEADIVNEDVPRLKAKLAAFVQAPSVAAAQEIGDMWRALAQRCREELGDEPHHAVLLAGLCADDSRLGNRSAFDLFHREGAPEIESVGPIQLMSRLLEIAGDLEARLASLAPDEARFAAIVQHVARQDVERAVGISPGIKYSGDHIWDGNIWRKVPPGKTPADVLATSSIADAFREPLQSQPSAARGAQPRNSQVVGGRSNADVLSAELATARGYIR